MEFQKHCKGAVKPRHAERGMRSDPYNLVSRSNEMMGLFHTMDLSRKIVLLQENLESSPGRPSEYQFSGAKW